MIEFVKIWITWLLGGECEIRVFCN